MKKILASLLVMALCAPAMAATISIADNGDCTATITVEATADGVNLVGLGLDVDVDAGQITAVSVDTANFNIYPDAAYTQELGGDYVYGTGTPVADKLVAGEIALPQSSFALSFGNLNGEATAGADGALVVEVTVTLSESATLTVAENPTRGGLVAVDGTSLDGAEASLAIVCGGCPTCLGDQNEDGVVDLFNDALNVALLLDGNNYEDITPVPAGYICADMDQNDVLDLFNDCLNIFLMLDATGYVDIPCP